MKRNWWKILAVLLLLYTIIGGFLVPLSPGIYSVSRQNAATTKNKTSANTGETIVLDIVGYNSHYTADKVNVWLKKEMSEYAICADKVVVKDRRVLEAFFTIPQRIPLDTLGKVLAFGVITDNEIDGFSIIPNALSIILTNEKNDSIPITEGCAMDGLHADEAFNFPFRNILGETIRNLYFHVTLWMAMMVLFMVSFIYSIRYLRGFDPNHDLIAKSYAKVGLIYGLLGIATGSIWAFYTWGALWSFDIKQNMAAIALLIYLAYFVLRDSFDDPAKQARIGAVYNIFAFSMLIPLLYVIPRLYSSLHPGNGGNPGFGGEDLDNTMRTIFYPAIIGWTLFGVWMANLWIRKDKIEEYIREKMN